MAPTPAQLGFRTVVHIGTADRSGGAAKAAYRLHHALRARGWDSRMLVAHQVTTDPEVARTRPTVVHRAADAVATRLLDAIGLQDVYYPSGRAIERHPHVTQSSVLQFHNLHGLFFPLPLIARLSRQRAAVWLLHDQWALTGHCAYSYDCDRWMTGCGSCPILREDHLPLRFDTTALHWRLRRRTYRKAQLDIVAPSRWLADLARRSPLTSRFAVHHIPYGIDLTTYRPLEKLLARSLLDLDPAERVVLFAAQLVGGNPRKGAALAAQAVRALPEHLRRGTRVVTVGQRGTGDDFGGLPVRKLGFVQDELLMAAVYSAADVFVIPTLADNLPLTVLESLACGTPVVGFDVGGVPDVVRPNETGYLARYGDVTDLSHGLAAVLQDDTARARMSRCARQVIEREFDLELQARRFDELYSELIARRAEHRSHRHD